MPHPEPSTLLPPHTIPLGRPSARVASPGSMHDTGCLGLGLYILIHSLKNEIKGELNKQIFHIYGQENLILSGSSFFQDLLVFIIVSFLMLTVDLVFSFSTFLRLKLRYYFFSTICIQCYEFPFKC